MISEVKELKIPLNDTSFEGYKIRVLISSAGIATYKECMACALITVGRDMISWVRELGLFIKCRVR